MTSNKFLKALIYILLTLGAFIMLFPFIWMILGSVKTAKEITAIPLQFFPTELHFENFTEVLTNPNNPFGIYFVNSVIVATANTVFTLLTTILAAFAFSRLDWPGRDRLFALLMATMMIPSQMFMITNYITISRMGLMDTLIAQILPFTASIFYIYLLRQFFNQIPDQIYLAAKVDGCSDWKYLWKIMVPNSVSSLITIALFNFIASWNAYMWPLMVTNSVDKRVLSIGIKFYTGDAGSYYNLQMAAATIVVLPLVVIYLVFQKYIIQGIARGGLKG